jgi:hypothetical protein
MSHSLRIRALLMGGPSSRKSHLLRAFATQQLVARDAAVSIRSEDFDVSIAGEPVQLAVFNSPDKAEQIHPALLKEVHCVAYRVGWRASPLSVCVQAAIILFVFSILDRQSLAEVESTFVPLVRLHAPKTALLLVGQDCDARAQSTETTTIEEAQDAAGRIGAKCYIECSSLTGDWVNTVFIEAVKVVYQSLHPNLDSPPHASLIPRAGDPFEPPLRSDAPLHAEPLDVPSSRGAANAASPATCAAAASAATATATAAAAAAAVTAPLLELDLCPGGLSHLRERAMLEAQRDQLRQELAHAAFEMDKSAKRSRDELAIAHKDCALLKERALVADPLCTGGVPSVRTALCRCELMLSCTALERKRHRGFGGGCVSKCINWGAKASGRRHLVRIICGFSLDAGST